ncbi:MAG: DUF4143 domain-containing protein, partial [Parachlamydiaceae bacterium]
QNIARSLLKEPKIYFFDTGLVKGNPGIKFENFVATCLLKHVFANIDMHGESYSLSYLQTKERQEVDFAIAQNEKLMLMIEAKYADAAVSPGLRYFNHKYFVPGVQLVKELKRERLNNGIEVRHADSFLKTLLT